MPEPVFIDRLAMTVHFLPAITKDGLGKHELLGANSYAVL